MANILFLLENLKEELENRSNMIQKKLKQGLFTDREYDPCLQKPEIIITRQRITASFHLLLAYYKLIGEVICLVLHACRAGGFNQQEITNPGKVQSEIFYTILSFISEVNLLLGESKCELEAIQENHRMLERFLDLKRFRNTLNHAGRS